MIIIVSGLSGSGNSTLAENLGKAIGLPVIHASHILKQLAGKKIHDIDFRKTEKSQGFWESPSGKKMLEKRGNDQSMDKALDKKLFEIIEKGNAVIDSKIIGYLSKKGIKIWLDSGLETRAKRIAGRSSISRAVAKKRIMERDSFNRRFYKNLYGFEFGKNLEKFDLVINNENLTSGQTLEKALEFLKNKKLI